MPHFSLPFPPSTISGEQKLWGFCPGDGPDGEFLTMERILKVSPYVLQVRRDEVLRLWSIGSLPHTGRPCSTEFCSSVPVDLLQQRSRRSVNGSEMLDGSNDEVQQEQDGAVEDRKLEFYACLLEPGGRIGQDASYTGTRRLLLLRKAQAGQLQRQSSSRRGNAMAEAMLPTGSTYGSTKVGRIRGLLVHQAILETADDGHHIYYLVRTGIVGPPGPSNSSGPRSHGSAAEVEVVTHNHLEPAYSFVGMHCIFDDIKASVNVLRFGQLSSDLLAFGAADGSLVICSVANPPSIRQHLKGHLKEVTDFDWSLGNQYFCSSSLDKSVRVWSVEKGTCLRVIHGHAAQLCIRFHPLNNNFLLVGHADQGLTVINFSTGRTLQRLSVERNITAMDISSTGHILFAGDSEGCVLSIKVDMKTGALSHKHRTTKGLHRKSPTTTVQYKNFSRLAGGPVLLVANQDGSLRFFSVALEVDGYLSLKCSLKLPPMARNIRASFCPLLSLERGEFIVSGNEDTNVYFYDFTRPKHPCVNKLQGHSVPAVGVAWNHGENLLATSDCEGVVIVWKRERDTH